jgi:hypothetical protein
LPSGNVVIAKHDNTNALSQKEITALHNESSLMIKENPAPRTMILPSGNVVIAKHDNTNALSQKEITELNNETSLLIKENPAPRTMILPSGNVVTAKHDNTNAISQRDITALHKEASLMIKENPVPRIMILPSGNVVTAKHDNTNAISQRDITAQHKEVSLMIKENPAPRIMILASGNVVATNHEPVALSKNADHQLQNNPSMTLRQNSEDDQIISNNVAAVTKDSLQKSTTLRRDSIALPADYAERKKNVIRTLSVNADSIMLRVYDNGVVDGDIVSVIYNDNVVIDKLSLTSHAVVVKIPVNPSQINTLVFHAHNLGEYPPNTAKLEILYGNKKEELTVSSDLTVSSTIDIVHQ